MGKSIKKISKNLDSKPLLDRDVKVAMLGTNNLKPHFIVVGASHSSRLAVMLESKGATVLSVTTPSWRPTASTVEKAAKELSALTSAAPPHTVIIFQFLDCAAYYARTEEGSLIPSRRGLDNIFHLDGELIMAPRELFAHTLKTSLPLFEAAGHLQSVTLSPLPRYWISSCCEDKDHIPNSREKDFEKAIFSGLDELRRQCKDFLHIKKIKNASVLNACQLVVSTQGSRLTGEDTISNLRRMWGDGPVHANQECYDGLASNLLVWLHLRSAELSMAAATPLQGVPAAKRPRWAEESMGGRGASTFSRGCGPGRGFRGRGGRGWRW